jgi:hypothetical protein
MSRVSKVFFLECFIDLVEMATLAVFSLDLKLSRPREDGSIGLSSYVRRTIFNRL